MTVVVDASLAVKWVTPEVYTQESLSLRNIWLAEGELVIAPYIFRSEVMNVLHQKARRGIIAGEDAHIALDHLLSAIVTAEPAGLYNRALRMAGELRLASAYDALYLALAEFESCEMWTADERLVRTVRLRFPGLRFVGESR
ncbi:MAG: type II toxin-antitoxin system VapC family toxin [Chloroflexi bacterium]|nr:type II toxin-antitoxin system VapC family toxin [Chloroflexota bacterium]